MKGKSPRARLVYTSLLGDHGPDLGHLSFVLPVLHLCEWNRTVCIVLSGFCGLTKVFEIHTCCCKYQSLSFFSFVSF